MINIQVCFLSLIIIGSGCNSDPQRPDSAHPSKAVKSSTDVQPSKVTEDVVKTEPEQSNDTTPRERLEFRIKVNKPSEIAAFRSTALNIMNYRLKDNPETMAMIEVGTWEYAFVYDGEMSAAGVHNGIWVDFKRDHTYSYGKNSTVQGTGKYNYHVDRGELLMIDDKSSVKPFEWTVKTADDTMILIGTPTYQDNHVQMKLIKVSDSIQSAS